MSYTLEFQNIIWTKPPFLGLKSSFSRQKYFIKTPRLPSTTQEPCDLMIIQMKGNQRTDFTPPTGIFITMFEGVLEITLAKTTNDFLGLFLQVSNCCTKGALKNKHTFSGWLALPGTGRGDSRKHLLLHAPHRRLTITWTTIQQKRREKRQASFVSR